MKKIRLLFLQVMAIAVIVQSFVIGSGSTRGLQDSGDTLSNGWVASPSAPKIRETDRLAELARRRTEVMKRVGSKGILVLFSAMPRVYTYDVDYPFRQENNLYYLTGVNQPGVTLVLVPGAKRTREILFVPPRNPRAETWTGHMLSADEARARSGVQEVWEDTWLNTLLVVLAPRAGEVLSQRGSIPKIEDKKIAEWRDDFQTPREAIRSNEGELYLLLPSERESREFKSEQVFAGQMASMTTGLMVKDAGPILADLRVHKSPWELRLLKHATDITAEAFHTVYSRVSPGVFEYELQAEFEYAYHRYNANWGYPCIIGGGANATTLHYETNQDALPATGLVLMDCGAEYDHYSVDITRTLPITGKFSREEAEIYRLVYAAQQEAIRLIRPGVVLSTSGARLTGNPIYTRSAEIIKDGLLRLGLITSKDNDEYRTWFMHGSTHWIGMNVHDVGNYAEKLTPGMIFTVEPGIYIRPDALDVLPKTPENEKFIAAVRPAFEKYKGIGVRIEDDVLVTESGAQVMSAIIPSRLEDIEAEMARLKADRTSNRGRPSR